MNFLKTLLISACLFFSPVLGDKDYRDRSNSWNIDSNKRGFVISSLPRNFNQDQDPLNPESFSFRFQAQDNSNSYEMKYQVYDSSNINTAVASEYKVRMYNLIQFIESNNGIPGLDPTDTICQSQYSPYSIGAASYVFTDLGVQTIDGVSVKEIASQDQNGIVNFNYKFTLNTNNVPNGVWKYGSGKRQFVDATSVKFDMFIDTDAVTNFYAQNSDCNGKDSSQIKLAVTAFTKTKFRYPVPQNQTSTDDDGHSEDHDDGNSDYRTVVKFGPNAGFFTWEPAVNTNKGDVPVLASPLQKIRDNDNDDDDDVRRVVWTFNTTRPVYINWDPQIGYVPSVSSAYTLYTNIWIVMLGFVVSSFYVF